MSEKQKLWIQLCVVDTQVRKRVLNLKTMEGLREPLEAFGFTREGQPVFTNDPSIHFRLSGGYRSGVNLNSVFSPAKRGSHSGGGVRLYGRDKDGKLVEKAHLFGFEALSVFLSQKGCAVTAEKVEKELTRLMREKTKYVHCYRLDNFNGLVSSHGHIKDEWAFDGARLETDDIKYDAVNEILAEIGSPWRILSDEVIQTLGEGILKDLMKQ